MAHLRFVDNFDELSDTFRGEARPPLEVACIDGLAPSGRGGKTHGRMVELDKLLSVFTFVYAVREEGRHIDIRGDFIVGGVVGGDVVGVVRNEGNAPHVRLHVTPSSDDGLSIESYFTSMHVKKILRIPRRRGQRQR